MKPAEIREELDKASSLVVAARRLLATGTMVDLSALEGKVRGICESLAGLPQEDGRALLPPMERLIHDLDRLAADIGERMEPETVGEGMR